METAFRRSARALVAFAFALVSLTAAATDPVAVWTGFADGATIDGTDGRTYTFNANGNTIADDGSSFTIGSTNSTVSFSTAYASLASTIIVRYSAFSTSTSYQTLITLSGTNTNSAVEYTKSLIGLCATPQAGLSGMWQGVIYTSNGDVNTYTMPTNGGFFAMRRDGTVGVQGFVNGQLDNNQSGIKASNFCINEINFGGSTYAKSSGTKPVTATGLTITGIAIFDTSLTQDQIAAYEFPEEETSTTEVMSINFNADGYQNSDYPGVTGASVDVSSAIVEDSNWYHDGQNNSTNYTFSNGVKFTWSSACVWAMESNKSAGTMINGYLDDGKSESAAISMTVENLDYDSYDLILYRATDSESGYKFSAVSINGTDWTAGDDGIGVGGSDAWGSVGSTNAVLGTNTMRINGLTGTTLTIGSKPRNDTTKVRGGIAAIQIVGYRESEADVKYITGTEYVATEGWYTNQTHAVDVAVGETAVEIDPNDVTLTPTTHIYQVKATMNFAVATSVDELLEDSDTNSLFGVQLADDGYLYAYNPSGAWEKTQFEASLNTNYRISLVLDRTAGTGKMYVETSDATNCIYSMSASLATPTVLALSGEGTISFVGWTSDADSVGIVVEADGEAVEIDENGDITVKAGAEVVISGGTLAGEVHVIVPNEADSSKPFDITEYVTGIAKSGTFTTALDSDKVAAPVISAVDVDSETQAENAITVAKDKTVAGLYYVLEANPGLVDLVGEGKATVVDDAKQATGAADVSLAPKKTGSSRFFRVKVQLKKPTAD